MLNLSVILIIPSWIATVVFFSFIAKKYFPDYKELPRKIVHIGIGPLIPIAYLLGITKLFALNAAIFITITLIINYKFKILSIFENINRNSYGTVAYGISISILIALFWETNSEALIAGILAMSFGDGLAGLIGRQVNSRNWMVFGQKKSVAGTLTMTLITGMIFSVISFFDSNPFNLLLILVVTFFAVLLEQISIKGIDNLTVPIGVACLWNWIA